MDHPRCKLLVASWVQVSLEAGLKSMLFPAFWVSSLESAMAIVVAGLFPGFKLFSGPVGAHLLSTIQHP